MFMCVEGWRGGGIIRREGINLLSGHRGLHFLDTPKNMASVKKKARARIQDCRDGTHISPPDQPNILLVQ